MDNIVIEQKLESLRRSLQRIKEKCPKILEILKVVNNYVSRKI